MRRVFVALCLGFGALVLPSASANEQDQARTARTETGKSGIAARVNDEIITWDEVNEGLKKSFPKEEDRTDAIRHDHLRHLVEERLFHQEAKRHKIAVTEEEVDQHIKNIVKTLGSEEKYDEWRRWMNLTKEAHREQVRKDILEIKLYRYLIQKSWTNPNEAPLLVEFISPEEIREYYERNKKQYTAIRQASIGRIALDIGDAKRKEERRRLAESILRKIDVGTDFYMLAFVYSDIKTKGPDEQSNYHMKDLKPEDKYFSPATMKYLFEILEVGKHSGIIEEGNTLNIFQLEKRTDKKEETFDEAQVQIRVSLEHRKREANRKELRNHILKGAYIEPQDLFSQD